MRGDDLTETSVKPRRIPGSWWGLAVVQVLVLVAGVVSIPSLTADDPAAPAATSPATSTPSPSAPSVASPVVDAGVEISAVLKARDRAFLARNRTGYLAAARPKSAAARVATRTFTNTASVPMSAWEETLDPATLKPVPGSATRFSVEVTRTYRLKGYDPGGVKQRRKLTVDHVLSKWVLIEDALAAGSRRELWETGPVVVARGKSSIVLAHPNDQSRIAGYAALTDAAVKEVTSIWGAEWARKVVVVVPATTTELGQVLDSTADYAQIAALATADVVDSQGKRSALAERVVINPSTFRRLSSLGQRIVMTHEVTHVASRLDTGKASPSWLVEGLADYVAYRDSGVSVSVVARDLGNQVRAEGLPTSLPADADFEPGSKHLGATYELSWLACRLIAARTNERKLIAFYKAVGRDAGPQSDGVKRQFDAVLDTTPESFLAAWRTYIDEIA